MLEHRTRRPVVSPCPSHARPARVRSQVCAVWRWRIERSCWLCTRPPRGPRCRCGCDAPSNESWTAQLHARTRQRPPATWVASGWAAQISSNPPPDGRAWENGRVWEDGWPVSAVPKLVIRSGRGLGDFPPQATLIFLFQLHVHRMLWALGEINKGLVHVPAMWGGIWEAHSLRTQAPQLSSLGWTSTSRRK